MLPMISLTYKDALIRNNINPLWRHAKKDI